MLLNKYREKLERPDIVGNAKEFVKRYCISPNADPDWDNITPWKAVLIVRGSQVDDKEVQGAFWHVWDFANKLNPNSRLACIAFYALATLLALIVIGQNVLFVISNTIERFISA
jgi:hypothetical protein